MLTITAHLHFDLSSKWVIQRFHTNLTLFSPPYVNEILVTPPNTINVSLYEVFDLHRSPVNVHVSITLH